MRYYYKTNLEALEAEIKNKTELSQKMRKHVKEIEKAMSTLTKEKYSGPSADAFRDGMSKMTGQVLVKQIDLVDDTVRTLKELYVDYADLKCKSNRLGEIFGVDGSMAPSGDVACDIYCVDEMKTTINRIIENECAILDTLDEVEDTLYGTGCDDSVFMAIEDAKASVEGNAGDAVRNRSYNITHGDIVGYGSNGGMNNQSLISKVNGTAYEGDLGTR